MTQCYICFAPATASPNLCLSHAACETVSVSPQPEVRVDPPPSLLESPAWQGQSISPDGRIWKHQAKALELLNDGRNVVVATPTASGKSLIFQQHAVRTAALGTGKPLGTKRRSLVMYPLKALSRDQLQGWQNAAGQAGMEPSSVAVIDGDVKDKRHRLALLDTASITLATPDIVHAWLLLSSQQREVRNFLTELAVVIIDEAHTYTGMLGSNAAYLFRRLNLAVAALANGETPQYVAASATVRQPARFLEELTNLPFQEITGKDDGSPRHTRLLHHLACTPYREEQAAAAAVILHSILDSDPQAQIIVFYDSRQGVENLVATIGRDDVMPYRAGYAESDRRAIEQGLRQNRLRAVVTTSALELGIDMPDLNYGIQVGLPSNRKSLHQRIGRVGRRRPAEFVILAPPETFAAMGDKLSDYYRQPPEDSHLYLENLYIRKGQAECAYTEMNQHHGRLEDVGPWPKGFTKAVAKAAGAGRNPQRKPPQHTMPLRSHEAVIMTLETESGKTLGTIEMNHAMRETYPGAVYRHLKKPYLVRAWKRKPYGGDPYLVLQEIPPHIGHVQKTIPIIEYEATLKGNINDASIGSRVAQRRSGSIAEVRLNLDLAVHGYLIGDREIDYDEARTKDEGLTRKRQRIATTGVIIRFNHPALSGNENATERNAIGSTLKELICYRNSYERAEIAAITGGVSIRDEKGLTPLTDSLLIYDTRPGGFRLSKDLYDDIGWYAARINANTAQLDYDTEPNLVTPELSAAFRQLANEITTEETKFFPMDPSTPEAAELNGSLRRVLQAETLVKLSAGGKASIGQSGLDQEGRVIYRCQRVRNGDSTQKGETIYVTESDLRPADMNWRRQDRYLYRMESQ